MKKPIPDKKDKDEEKKLEEHSDESIESLFNSNWNSFWFRYKRKFSTIRIFVFLFYFLGGVDMWLQLSRMPKYGGGFNVSDFHPFLLRIFQKILPTNVYNYIEIGPEPSFMAFVFIFLSILCFRVSFGVSAFWEKHIIAFLYGVSYFISQIDDYQHHYLLVFVYVLMSFLDIEQNTKYVFSWVIRLLTIQISVLYLWTSIAKLDPLWYNGYLLKHTITSPKFTYWIIYISNTFFISDQTMFSWLSIGTIALEVFLSFSILFSQSSALTILIGIHLHIFMDISGISIGRFSHFMILFYFLLLPASLEDLIEKGYSSFLQNFFPKDSVFQKSSIILFLLWNILGFFLVFWFVDFESMGYALIGALTIILLCSILHPKRLANSRNGFLQFTICLIILLLFYGTNQVSDYYITESEEFARKGDLNNTIHSLYKAIAIDPNNANLHANLAIFVEINGDPVKASKINYHILDHFDSSNLKALVGLAHFYSRENNKELVCKFLVKANEKMNQDRNRLCSDVKCHDELRYSKGFASKVISTLNNNYHCF